MIDQMSGIVPTEQLARDRFRSLFSRLREWLEIWLDRNGRGPAEAEPERSEVAWHALRVASEALAECGRFDEADEMAERGLAAFPDQKELLIQHALNAHNSGRYAVAVDRWQQALVSAPDDPMFQTGLAKSSRELMGHDRTQTTTDDRTPPPLQEQRAESASQAERANVAERAGLQGAGRAPRASREDRSEALALLTAAARRAADETTGQGKPGLATAPRTVRRPPDPTETKADILGLPTGVEVVSDEVVRRLMMRFESIGDNSEMGLVQRRYAAEPLGLLRWNEVAFDQLIEAIQGRFQGMGDEANLEIDVAPSGEFFVHDRRWFLAMHTFIDASQANRDVVRKRMCRRVTYLRDKLLSDIVEAEKVFVYRSSEIDDDRLAALHRALAEIGPATLLAVQPINAATSFRGGAGEIMKVDGQRYVGFLSRDGRGANGLWDIAFDDWVSICRKVTEQR